MIIGEVTGEINVDGQPNQLFEQEITREYLQMANDAFKELVGDGEGRVSVTLNMKDSDFGRGFGASVTTSLTCDQSVEGLEDGFLLAKGLSLQFLADAYHEAERMYLEARDGAPEEKRAPRKKRVRSRGNSKRIKAD